MEALLHETSAQPIYFGAKLMSSAQFRSLFQEGMDLVADAAAYLDGEGRDDSKRLNRAGALAYSVESMRLTTRLLQLASWLLLQRAVNEGELSAEDAGSDKHKIQLSPQDVATNEETFGLLPLRLCELIDHSIRLQGRILHLDDLLQRAEADVPQPVAQRNPVAECLDALKAALAREIGEAEGS
ncbi:protease adaptor protein RcdA [Beijerinckia mobilis]|uniref:protease adaptor protein RcdA n=1 Tax=Beijerinckia mobilis TaxID=231434 RepID=UPI000550C667|nr:DUF1465 family protein [Beijerinckia mobilis]